VTDGHHPLHILHDNLADGRDGVGDAKAGGSFVLHDFLRFVQAFGGDGSAFGSADGDFFGDGHAGDGRDGPGDLTLLEWLVQRGGKAYKLGIAVLAEDVGIDRCRGDLQSVRGDLTRRGNGIRLIFRPKDHGDGWSRGMFRCR